MQFDPSENAQFSRTALVLGKEALKKLASSRVAVFGLGGVGGSAAEALVRAGVGSIDLIDNDVVSPSNLNRQLFALNSTVGRYKTDAAAERLADINPRAVIRTHRVFILPGNASDFDFGAFDFVIDAVDTLTAKLAIVSACREAGTPMVSSMGTGDKIDPSALYLCDVFETSVCPLARLMRKKLRAMGIDSLRVVASRELPLEPFEDVDAGSCPPGRRRVPGSVSFVPPVAGYLAASEAVRVITGFDPSGRRRGE
ncbi:MAG: tRNA threonylcarbamoyladenosine dehydratase [Clostridia bacterium]|nr:tRNA threonylcarbamoyladenosine dehydratase [Clostridia bacterium]